MFPPVVHRDLVTCWGRVLSLVSLPTPEWFIKSSNYFLVKISHLNVFQLSIFMYFYVLFTAVSPLAGKTLGSTQISRKHSQLEIFTTKLNNF